MANPRRRRTRAVRLCRHFDGTDLAGCARPGLDVLEAEHKVLITTAGKIACGVALDRCREQQEPTANRWDYVFTLREGNKSFAIEVHHAAADQADNMIAKKRWAEQLIASRCPNLECESWIWVAPLAGSILFDRLHPTTRLLAEAKITYPIKRCPLP